MSKTGGGLMYKVALLVLALALAVTVPGQWAAAQEEAVDTAQTAVDTAAAEPTETTAEPIEAEAETPAEEPAEEPAEAQADTLTEEPGEGESVEPGAVTSEEEAGDTTGATAEQAPEDAAEEESVAAPEEVDPSAPYTYVTFGEDEKPRVVMETTMGNMVLELWPDIAPKHCQSFVHLTKTGFYDSLTFHRVVPGFVIQGGDPNGNGTGGPGYNVPAEFNPTPHEDGILSMARSSDPNSAGSQFFICLGRLASLDNQYTVFGKVVEGLEVAHSIEKVPVTSERPNTPVVMTRVYLEE
jgi:peptidyl-prolyl cis-trans isomerase B (cyclophilin B)